MTAVSNATPVIYLAKGNSIYLLKETYGQIYLCSDVWREAVHPIMHARPIPEDVPLILAARSEGWLKVRDVEIEEALGVRNELVARGLGAGESNSIALAKELKTLLLANDESAILAARIYGVETRWFTEILHDALKADALRDVGEYTRLLDVCISKGLYVSRREREQAIRIAHKIRRQDNKASADRLHCM